MDMQVLYKHMYYIVCILLYNTGIALPTDTTTQYHSGLTEGFVQVHI